MKTITLEMPIVTKCIASECVYNANSSCHARAITIGDSIHPGCDTFLAGSRHTKSVNQIAGIGACKTVGCKFNNDLECIADSIQVGMVKNEANCMTFDLC
ncbi:MAG: DUF1540 domain-containing protein [Nitrosomonadales bacterium]|nr:DUF1540 domain-containing protein [Nitrosomonadales bacterium]